MLILTANEVPGKQVEALGLVKGNVVRSKHAGKDFMAGMKSLVGGELHGYTEMLNEAREIATSRMVAEAEKLEADAIVMMRYGSATILQGSAEIITYGTTVKFV